MPEQLTETQGAKQPKLLKEESFFVPELVEGAASGALKFRGKFGQVDVSTENKRMYPRPVIESNIARLSGDMTQRGLYGELDHPPEPGTKLQRASHIITKLEVRPNGDVMGEAEVLPTPAGQVLAKLVESRCRIGVSSRGYGSTKINEQGKEVVADDYRLVAYDVVADPAASGSYPKAYYECVEEWKKTAEKEIPVTDPAIQSQPVEPAVRAQIEAQVRAEVRAEMGGKLAESVAASKARIEQQVRSELLSDPKVAGAKVALESVQKILLPFVLPADTAKIVEAKDAQLAKSLSECADLRARVEALTKQLGEAELKARVLGYRLYVEKRLRNVPEYALVVEMLGDYGAIPTPEALKTKVDSVLAQVKEQQEARAAELAKVEEAKAEVQKQLDAAAEKIRIAEAKNEEAVRMVLSERLRSYALDQALNEDHRTAIRSMVETRQVPLLSQHEADDIVARAREQLGRSTPASTARARVQEQLGRGHGAVSLQEERNQQPPPPAPPGADLAPELRSMVGASFNESQFDALVR